MIRGKDPTRARPSFPVRSAVKKIPCTLEHWQAHPRVKVLINCQSSKQSRSRAVALTFDRQTWQATFYHLPGFQIMDFRITFCKNHAIGEKLCSFLTTLLTYLTWQVIPRGYAKLSLEHDAVDEIISGPGCPAAGVASSCLRHGVARRRLSLLPVGTHLFDPPLRGGSLRVAPCRRGDGRFPEKFHDSWAGLS